jgi:hypothetical protein
MSHTGEITTDQTEPNSKAIWISAIVTVVTLVALFLFSIGIFKTGLTNELNAKENVRTPQSIVKMRTYESEQLNTIKWLDKPSGKVQVSIDIAKKLVLDDYAN